MKNKQKERNWFGFKQDPDIYKADPKKYPFVFHTSQQLFKVLDTNFAGQGSCAGQNDYQVPVIYTTQFPTGQYGGKPIENKPSGINEKTGFPYYLQLLIRNKDIQSSFGNNIVVRLGAQNNIKRYIHVIENNGSFEKHVFKPVSSQGFMNNEKQIEFIGTESAKVVESFLISDPFPDAINIPEWMTVEDESGIPLLGTFLFDYYLESLEKRKPQGIEVQRYHALIQKLTQVRDNPLFFLKQVSNELGEYIKENKKKFHT